MDIVEFCLIWCHSLRAEATTEMLRTVVLVQSTDNVVLYQFGASATSVAIDPLAILFAICQSVHLEVPFPIEGPLAFGTGKVLDMPPLAQGGDTAFGLNGPTTAAANGHLERVVMTPSTVEIRVHLAHGVWFQFDTARMAIEMICMIGFLFVHKRWSLVVLYESFTLVANRFPLGGSLELCVASMAQGSFLQVISVVVVVGVAVAVVRGHGKLLNKSHIAQRNAALVA